MKKIGLIGGTGPESTLVYYVQLNKAINVFLGGNEFPEIVIESVNLGKALGLVAEEKYDELTEYLGDAARHLENSGADIIALTAGTMHVVYDQLKDKVTKPFISIPEVVGEYAINKGYKKVGLLGTIFTMEKDFLKKSFLDRGVEVIVPEKAERELVNDIISNELEHGQASAESEKKLIDIIKKMKEENGIEAIVLGCTELPLVIDDENSPVDVIDIMNVHIGKLVELATK